MEISVAEYVNVVALDKVLLAEPAGKARQRSSIAKQIS